MHDTTKPRHIKCSGACGEYKAPDQFYRPRQSKASKPQRASPYCIDCNTRAVRLARLRKEVRTQGSEAFARRIKQKSDQLDDMVSVLAQFQKQAGQQI